MGKKITTAEFVERAKKKHNNKYDYSKVNYKTSKDKVVIICPKHGEFEQIANSHLMGFDCKLCGNIKSSMRQRGDIKQFLKEAKKIHGNKYDYSKVDYKNHASKIIIICKEHGEFKQSVNAHLAGQGCSICYGNKKSTKQKFVERAKKIHGNKYDYSKTYYKNNHTKIKIICPEHGEFNPTPKNHLINKSGCPICRESKGEKFIRLYLLERDVCFIQQKKFKDCRNIRPLPFDFYLPDYNICIEYDGVQHFKPVKQFGGLKGFQEIIKNDKVKTKYCKDKKIKLIRISKIKDIECEINKVI